MIRSALSRCRSGCGECLTCPAAATQAHAENTRRTAQPAVFRVSSWDCCFGLSALHNTYLGSFALWQAREVLLAERQCTAQHRLQATVESGASGACSALFLPCFNGFACGQQSKDSL